MEEIMVPKCSLTSDDATCSIGAMCGLLQQWPMLLSASCKIQSCYEQTTLKAYSKMGLESNFTFAFTSVLKLDPTTLCYHEHTTRLQPHI